MSKIFHSTRRDQLSSVSAENVKQLPARGVGSLLYFCHYNYIMAAIKKLWNDYGMGAVIVLGVIAYGVLMFMGYLGGRGGIGSESNSQMQSQYKGSSGGTVQPAEALGHNATFASANGLQTTSPGLPASCSNPNIQNPADLLPKDANSQWTDFNPSGKGELANVNLLKAGYHIGINTVGQSMRNANLQIRSEIPNPQVPISIWNQSTITPDFMRVPFEIGSGAQ